MRVLFATFPWRTHHWPMVPVEWACRVAGHEVVVTTTPALTAAVEASGLPAVAVGRDIDIPQLVRRDLPDVWADREQWPADYPAHPERLGDRHVRVLERLAQLQITMAEAMVGGLVSFARRWQPDLIVHNTSTLAGPVAAAVMEVPSVSHHWGSPGLYQIEMRGLGTEPLPGYAALFDRFDVPVRTTPDLWIDLCPPSIQLPTRFPRVQTRYVPYNGAARMPPWLSESPSRPRVCLTWGETYARLLGGNGVDLFRTALDAVSTLDVEVVVATTADQRDVLGTLPPNARAEFSLPLHMLLPSCTAIVHHGGAGSTMTAVAHGVPQLVISQRPEQALCGEKLEAAGVARHLRYGALAGDPAATDAIRSEVEKLIADPSCTEAANRLRAEVAEQPPPSAVVPVLEQLCED